MAPKTPILSGQMIRTWKEQIHADFPEMTAAQKAMKLADKVHQALYSQMPDFPAELKRKMTIELLKKAFEQPEMMISKDELFQQMIMNGELHTESLQIPMANWLKKETGQEWSIGEVAELSREAKSTYFEHGDSNFSLEQASAVKSAMQMSQQEIEAASVQTAAADHIPFTTSHSETEWLSHKNDDEQPLIQRGWTSIYRWLVRRRLISGVAAAGVMLTAIVLLIIIPREGTTAEAITRPLPEARIFEHYEAIMVGKRAANSSLPADYRYRDIDEHDLRTWLNERNSLLSESPYFDAIVLSAKQAHIHPYVLFAVTGQEQGFVPRDRKDADRMANNPFNVYHSWMEYNTTIEDSSRIAAKTINNLSRNRPNHIPVLQWVNRKYAEDPNWWIGVESLFRQMLRELETDKVEEIPNLL
ncbi:hypothetical protein [Marinicrinis lubricantis]|uniref:Mannosyl-glycoprotein endo-beta-N-acetylglucosaminidase n=1 Tax=Marinicrinis lubricantis TaxID=2086470 RepID=A0ABW1ITG9_9BACL